MFVNWDTFNKMEIFSYLAIFLLIRRVQKAFRFSPLRFKWASLFTMGLWSCVGVYVLVLCVVGVMDDGLNGVKLLVGSLSLLGIVTFADKEPDFLAFRPFLRAHYPLIAATFIMGFTELILRVFPGLEDNYEKVSGVLIFGILGAFVWIFARGAANKKQLEELSFANQQNLHLDKLVAERTAEITKQKNELQETLELLQTTQRQLIQSEKLASLGELTAGIAHEIQNPLNFVNNFSEVSIELLTEMGAELNSGDKEEVIAIAEDVKRNLEKILHHGKRADGIVKGMLQHSRASNGVKELTDINKLADEYLRLAYHGLRAKDKSFNAELVTHFGEGLPAINVVPQDIGRVLLNLFTNAFYAVQQKQKKMGDDFRPVITLTTDTLDGKIRVKVKDNGIGIPDVIKDKIMQPFFTTKPTGEGTGLGLSLSYDMVVKGHGGSITVDTREGECCEFTIMLPVNHDKIQI